MNGFSDRVQNTVIDDENSDAESADYNKAEEDALDAVDPKSARKEAVWGMKRELIMDAAIKVMTRDGLMNVRLEGVAEEAGFSKAAIYHYFPDKEALIINIVIREQRVACEHLSEVVDRGLSFTDSLREFANIYQRSFGYSADALGRSGTPFPSMFTSIIASMTKHEALFKETFALKQKIDGLIAKIIARAKADGTLTIPIDDETVVSYINAFYQVLLLEHMKAHQLRGAAFGSASSHDLVKETTDKLLLLFKPWIKEK